MNPETMDPRQVEIIEPQTPDRDRFEIGIVIMTWNRPRYLERCLASLARSRLRDTVVAIVDDGSDDPNTLDLIRDFDLPGVPVARLMIGVHEHFLLHENLRLGWDYLIDRWRGRYLANLDSDAIVVPEWLERLRDLYLQHRDGNPHLIVSGFNGAVYHPARSVHEDHVVKPTLSGLNMFFDRAAYDDFVRDALQPYWDWQVVKAMQKRSAEFLVTRPSVVQHIGLRGLFSSGWSNSDFALDFPGSPTWLLRIRLLAVRLRHGIRRQLKRLELHGPR
jgi:glycosyltransferase involved in cell wall biosynthesis